MMEIRDLTVESRDLTKKEQQAIKGGWGWLVPIAIWYVSSPSVQDGITKRYGSVATAAAKGAKEGAYRAE
jgi:hypothetical protein